MNKATGETEQEWAFTLHRAAQQGSLSGCRLGRAWEKPAVERSRHEEQQVQRSWGKHTFNLLIIDYVHSLPYDKQRYHIIWEVAIRH